MAIGDIVINEQDTLPNQRWMNAGEVRRLMFARFGLNGKMKG